MPTAKFLPKLTGQKKCFLVFIAPFSQPLKQVVLILGSIMVGKELGNADVIRRG